MEEKYCCVIDAKDRYVTFVLILNGDIQFYTLKDGERLIDTNPPTKRQYAGADGFVSPVWDANTSEWVEGATDGIEIIHKGNDVWVDALGRVVS